MCGSLTFGAKKYILENGRLSYHVKPSKQLVAENNHGLHLKVSSDEIVPNPFLGTKFEEGEELFVRPFGEVIQAAFAYYVRNASGRREVWYKQEDLDRNLGDANMQAMDLVFKSIPEEIESYKIASSFHKPKDPRAVKIKEDFIEKYY